MEVKGWERTDTEQNYFSTRAGMYVNFLLQQHALDVLLGLEFKQKLLNGLVMGQKHAPERWFP